MSDDGEIRIRPGRMRSTRAQHARSFVAQVLAAARRAGGDVSRAAGQTGGRRSRLGRGQRASIQANRLVSSRSRGAVVKARVVRHTAFSSLLATHLDYLRRDGVTRDGEKARLFGSREGEVDGRAFAGRCADDRHHFRFVVSPDDAVEMSDLRSFTRDLVGQMERDLHSRLDWVAVDHWNTGHPHVHLIVRGMRDDGQDLVISRDYIKEGMRDRARDFITQELGPRTDLDIRRTLEKQVKAERWTQLDRQIGRDADRAGVINLAPQSGLQPDAFHAFKLGRLRALEILGIAEQVGPSQWCVAPQAEAVLREMGERGDIIKRMHRGLTERGIERAASSYVLAGESLGQPIIGRLVERGLNDELRGTAYAVVDGVDGRVHHIRFPHLDATGDAAPGAIVELRMFEDGRGEHRLALAVRSDFDLPAQVTAVGATWLDRQAVGRVVASLSTAGFGAEVRQALHERADHLIGQGLATRQAGRVVLARNLIETLRRRDLDQTTARLASETGLTFNGTEPGKFVGGTYRQRVALASGRFAMLDNGLGFQLVPWSPSLEKQLGRHVSGVARGDGGVDWSFNRKRGLGL